MSSIKRVDKNKCSSTELKILGDFWTLQLIQALSDGEKRFSQLEREIPGVNPTTLSSRLKKLEKRKIIARRKDLDNKLSIIYSLTDKGLAIIPILAQIKKFADKYL